MKDLKKLDSCIYPSLALSYSWKRPPEIFEALRDKNVRVGIGQHREGSPTSH